jgi:hypothetical protein
MSLIAQDPTTNFAVKPEDYPMPRFLLFRATVPVPAGVTHTGYARCAHCERISYVEARTVEPDKDCPVKHFEGNTAAVDVSERKPERKPPPKAAPQRELVLESLPFNDPLPPLHRTPFDSVSPDPMPPPLVLDQRPLSPAESNTETA